MAVHGAYRSFTINGRGFKIAHDGSGNKSIGGRNNELGMNGDGSYRILQTVTPGSLSDKQLEIDDSKGDLEFLQALSDSGVAVPVVGTTAANISYAGDLVITGEINKDESTGLVSLTFQGDPLTKI